MTAFHGFRVPSARLVHAEYGAGWFFVTVVTAGRVPCLCRVEGGCVLSSPAGAVVAEECMQTVAVRAGVVVDALVVTPDHVHLILGVGDVPSNAGVTRPARGACSESPP